MLKNSDAIATVGVRDLAKAKDFYGRILGLEEAGGEDCPDVLTYRSGNSKIFVYKSGFAGTNQATGITWEVGDRIAEIVAALKERGATFEHYEFDGMRLEGDIHVGEQMKVVWLKDPDGNILSINGK